MGPVQSIIHARDEAAKKKLSQEPKANETQNKELILTNELSDFEKKHGFKPHELKKETLKGMNSVDQHNMLQDLAPFIKDENLNNDIWNTNHEQINQAIANFLQKYGTMPSSNRIAKETGLTRVTVTRHLKEYREHPQYAERVDNYRFMKSDVMAKVLAQAVEGDLKAAKLYFELLDRDMKPSEISNRKPINQNNFIQINGVVISQETLEHIEPEQLKQIETIFRTSLPETGSISQ